MLAKLMQEHQSYLRVGIYLLVFDPRDGDDEPWDVTDDGGAFAYRYQTFDLAIAGIERMIAIDVELKGTCEEAAHLRVASSTLDPQAEALRKLLEGYGTTEDQCQVLRDPWDLPKGYLSVVVIKDGVRKLTCGISPEGHVSS
jgi:hypothetical protein